MNIKKAKKSLKQIAKIEGISLDMVRHEIEILIAEAWKNPDPKTIAYWKAIPCKGRYPTPEELIAYFAGKIEKEI